MRGTRVVVAIAIFIAGCSTLQPIGHQHADTVAPPPHLFDDLGIHHHPITAAVPVQARFATAWAHATVPPDVSR